MQNDQPRFSGLAVRTIVVHTVTYFLVGLLAVYSLDYAREFARPELACFMRPTNSRMVMAGPLFQPVRGLLFALAFYPLREVFFGKKRGWLVLWWTLVVLGILSTFGAAPGSLEGMVYTLVPLRSQLHGLPETLLQSLLLSLGLHYWVGHAEKKWINWVMGGAFVVLLTFPVLGLVVRR